MPTKLRVVFAGTPDFSLPSLDVLAAEHHLLWVYTQPDAPKGRGQNLLSSPVKSWAHARGILCKQPLKLGQNEAEELRKNRVDVLVVAAYGHIVPVSVLAASKYGALNVHASLLPRWRGASPIQHALLHGDLETGVGIMQMQKGLDDGPVLLASRYSIEGDDTALTLTKHLAVLGADALRKVLKDLQVYRSGASPQDPSLVTYAPKIAKKDAQINWSKSVDAVLRHVRAYNPWPTAFTFIGDTRIKIIQAVADTQGLAERGFSAHAMPSPGTLLAIDDGRWVIACGDGAVCLHTIQFPGKNACVLGSNNPYYIKTIEPGTRLIMVYR